MPSLESLAGRGVPAGRGRLLVAAVLTAGAVLRLVNYVQCRSLWIDEASLSLSLATRSYLGLFQPLDYNQAAPLLFLWVERLMIQLWGVNELALRLPPLIFGLATLPVVAWLAVRTLPWHAAQLAIALTAFSPALIVYSVELKPYSLDAFVGVVLISLGVSILERPDSQRRWAALLIAGFAGLVASTAAPLTLAGVGFGALCSPGVRGSAVARRWMVATAFVLGGLLAALYLAFYRAGDSAYMHTVWHANFLTPGTPALLERTWSAVREIVWATFLGGITSWGLTGARGFAVNCGTAALLGCVMLGAVELARRNGVAFAALLLGSTAAAFLASALQRYPISLRLVLFMVPVLILLGAGGVGRVTSSFGPVRGRRLLIAISALLLFRSATYDVLSLMIPARSEDGRTVIRDLERRHAEGEPVYVYSRGLVVWAFYTTDWTAPDTGRLRWFRDQGASDGAAFENAPTRGRPVYPTEGQQLRYDYRGRPELIGISTGVQWRALAGFSQPGPDRGWAEREAERIRAIARPSVWIFVTHPVDSSHELLLDRLQALGGRVGYRRIEWGAAVFQVRFD